MLPAGALQWSSIGKTLLAGGTAAESYRKDVAGRGAVAELLAGSAMAKRMAAPWRRAIGKLSLARAPWQSAAERRRYGGAFAGQGALAECHREDVSGQGTAAELHREAATAGKVRRATAGKGSHCWKGKERSATAGKKGLQRSNGLVSFFDAPLMQIIPIFVVW